LTEDYPLNQVARAFLQLVAGPPWTRKCRVIQVVPRDAGRTVRNHGASRYAPTAT